MLYFTIPPEISSSGRKASVLITVSHVQCEEWSSTMAVIQQLILIGSGPSLLSQSRWRGRVSLWLTILHFIAKSRCDRFESVCDAFHAFCAVVFCVLRHWLCPECPLCPSCFTCEPCAVELLQQWTIFFLFF